MSGIYNTLFSIYLNRVVVSLSLKVTECGCYKLSKGIATSSVLAYATEPGLSSILWEMSSIVRAWLMEMKLVFLREEQQGALGRSNDRRQGEVGPLIITFFHLETQMMARWIIVI